MLRYELYHPHITDICDLSLFLYPPLCSLCSLFFFFLLLWHASLSNSGCISRNVVRGCHANLASSLFSFFFFHILDRQVHVSVHTNTHALTHSLFSLTHTHTHTHTHTQEPKTHTSAEQTPISFSCVLNNDVWSEWIDQFLGTLFKHPEQADRGELKHSRSHSNACLLELTYTHVRYTLYTARGHQLFFYLFFFYSCRVSRNPDIGFFVSIWHARLATIIPAVWRKSLVNTPSLHVTWERNILF